MSSTKSITLDVVILGGGFAGVYCAKTLGRRLGRKRALRVGLISEENYMVFQPMLPEVAGSSISPRHVVNPLRLLCRTIQVLRGRVESIDWPARCLRLNAGPFSGDLCIRYHHLVLALGAVTDLSRIPGMSEHAFLMKNVGDAMHLRTTLLGRIEEANLEPCRGIKERLLTFVVVGGGYSGVETAGHLLDLFRSIRVYYPNVSQTDVKIYLIHGGNHLLPTLNRKLGDYSARKLKQRGLRLILNQRVKSVTAHGVYLENGEIIESNTVISTVGTSPHPLITRICEAGDLEAVKGAIVTVRTGQIKGETELWAAGDCAAFPDAGGEYCPNTAQFALQQGILIGKNIARKMRGRPLRNFTYSSRGEMASIGHHLAVAEILGFQFSGFFAWWLWRTVYLIKLPRFDRKVRVMLDWTLDLFFPRDLNHLSPRFTKPLKEMYLERGDVLFREGEPAFSLYLVKRGALEIRQNGKFLRRIGAGGYFGDQALVGDGLWHQEGRAAEPTRLVSIPAGVFHELVSGIGSLEQFLRKSAAGLPDADDRRQGVAAAMGSLSTPVAGHPPAP